MRAACALAGAGATFAAAGIVLLQVGWPPFWAGARDPLVLLLAMALAASGATLLTAARSKAPALPVAGLAATAGALAGASWIGTGMRPEWGLPVAVLLLAGGLLLLAGLRWIEGLQGFLAGAFGSLLLIPVLASLARILWVETAPLDLRPGWLELPFPFGIGFLLLSLGFIAFGWKGIRVRSRGLPPWAPITVVALGIAATLVLYESRLHQESLFQRQLARQTLDLIEQDLASRIGAVRLTLERMALRCHGSSSAARPPCEHWERDARDLLAEKAWIRSISWTDDSGKLRWMVSGPSGERESAGPAHAPLAPRLDLEAPLAGGRGVLHAGVEPDRLLGETRSRIAPGSRLEVREPTSGTPFTRVPSQWGSSAERLHRRVVLLGSPVEISLGLSPATRAEEETALAEIGIATGLLLSLLLGGTSHFARTSWVRAGEGRRRSRILALRHERARLAAEQAEKKFFQVLDAAPDPIVVTDASGVIVLVNSQTESEFGCARADLLGRPMEVLLPAVMRRTRRDPIAPDVGSHADPRQEGLWARRFDGTTFPVQINVSPLESGEDLLFTYTVRDVSDWVDARATMQEQSCELQRSNDELKQFAYVASHDLQEPLRMMSSYVSLLERRYRGQLDERADRYIHYVVDASQRMKLLIQDLLSYSRVRNRPIDLQKISSEEAFAAALRNLEAPLEETGAVVRHGDLPEVMADGRLLVQLFQNLLSNALKYCEHTPEIEVTACPDGDSLRFEIRDNGIGFESQYSDRIFEIFKRLHRNDAYVGTGIGLAICKKIVEFHGGRIRATSTPGEGSVFSFTIPLPKDLPCTTPTHCLSSSSSWSKTTPATSS